MSDSGWRREIRRPGAPEKWFGAEDRSEPICRWVSEDRRSRAARWGAWAPKIRRQFGINHLDRVDASPCAFLLTNGPSQRPHFNGRVPWHHVEGMGLRGTNH